MRAMWNEQRVCFHSDLRFLIPVHHWLYGKVLDDEISEDQHDQVISAIEVLTGQKVDVYHADRSMSLGDIVEAVGPGYRVREALLTEPKDDNCRAFGEGRAGTIAVLKPRLKSSSVLSIV